MDVEAIYISDIHLYSSYHNGHNIPYIFDKYNTNYLYLVGDILDFANMPDLYSGGNELIDSWIRDVTSYTYLIKKKYDITSVCHIEGNHERGVDLSRIVLYGKEFERIASNGKKYLICHGHNIDTIMAYNTYLKIPERFIDKYSYTLKVPQFIKKRLKGTDYSTRFRHAACRYARRKGFSGIICGHTHRQRNSVDYGIHYLNCGNLKTECEYIIEHLDGRFELIN